MTSNMQNNDYSMVAAVGGFSHVLEAMTLGHLLDRLKVEREVNPGIKSIKEAFFTITNQQGYKALYQGWKWNISISALKGSTGWSLNHLVNRWFQRHFPPDSSKNYPLTYTLGIGMGTGTLEALLACPLNRLKTIAMTSKAKTLNINDRGSQRLYQGFWLMNIRQAATWSSYLCAYKALQQKSRIGQHSPLSHQLFLGCATGAISSVVIAPLDCAITQVQQYGAAPKSPVTVLKKLNFRTAYQNYTLKMLKSAWSTGVILCCLNYMDVLPANMRA